ncbi:MAG: hypothetical protein NT027_20765 [Proteobacteria bacterium]|nr:hypothetical protein [Pseudomonadota bacterium]
MHFLSKTTSILISFSFLVGACGNTSDSNDSPNNGSNNRTTAPALSLIGAQDTKWKGVCTPNKEKDSSRQWSLNFADHTFERVESVYAGLTCANSALRISYVENWVNVRKESRELITGWSTFVGELASVDATPFQELVAMQFNKHSRYGFSDWKSGESKNVTGLKFDADADPELAAGVIRSRTLKIETDTLYFAKYENDVPVESRDVSFKKVP